MLKIFLLTVFFFVTLLKIDAQIINSNSESPKGIKKEKKKKEKVSVSENDKDSTNKSTYYLSAAYINSFRQFVDETPYANFQERNKETPIHTYGIGFGTFINLTNKLDLELGVSYVLQGEQYNFSDSLSDSTFHYTKRYRHFGIPLRLKYTIGNQKLKGFIYGGIIPSSILSYRYESNYTTLDGKTHDNDTHSKTNTLASFNVTTSAGFGASYQLKNIGLMIMPEFRYNLLNTYEGVLVSHNLWSWGVNFGITLKL